MARKGRKIKEHVMRGVLNWFLTEGTLHTEDINKKL
jgi:hypothetical protein